MPTRIYIALILCFASFSGRSSPGDALEQTGSPGRFLIHVWQTDDGLPQNWVSSIAQTPDGYLWIGTRYGGLARFDGVRFTPFNPQNTPDLKDVQVEHLSVDENGALWIVMGNESITSAAGGSFALHRWPRAQPRLRADSVLGVHRDHVLFSAEDSSLIDLDLMANTNGWKPFALTNRAAANSRAFFPDATGALWYIDRNRHLARYENGESREFRSESNIHEPATALAEDGDRRIWLGTPTQLGQWTGSQFVDRTPTNGAPLEHILQMVFSGDGGIWVYEKYRLRKYLGGQWVTDVNLEPSELATLSGPLDFYGDAQGNVWIISRGRGLWHARSDGSIYKLTEREGLPSTFITCWFQDNEGDVWIGTGGGGIARIRDRVFTVLGPSQGLPGKVVRSVCVDSTNALWIGTMSGNLARLEKDRFVPLAVPTDNATPVENITVSPSAAGGLWVGSSGEGLMRLQSGRFSRPIPLQDLSIVRILFEDTTGGLWVGGLAGLTYHKNGRQQSFGSDQGFQNSIAIGAVAEDSSGRIWIGTGPGDLWKYGQNQFTRYSPPSEWPSVRFSALLTDTNGTIWVGTLGGGLLRFRDGHFIRYTIQDGLPDNYISQLLDDHEGYLWVGSYAGIFRVAKNDLDAFANGNQGQLTCRLYGHFDGLPALECTSGFQPACWRSNDGQLWFATVNGVIAVNPDRLVPNRLPPKVIIEDMLVDGKYRPLHDANFRGPTASAFRIEPGRHYLQFQYTGLNFVAPDGVRFRVKLEGAEPGWQNMAGQRTVGYGPLQPGNYRLHVNACNSDGVWSKDGAELAFIILPYFWQTWWFKICLSLTLFCLLGFAIVATLKRRHRLEMQELERRNQIERERSRIARDLHDDLGTTLTQISMLSSLASRDQTPVPEIKQIIQQVRARAREMVVAMDEIVWAVNPKKDSFVELINYLGSFAEQFFHASAVRCRLEIPDPLPNLPLSSEVRHHLFLAFKEAINNAARHSEASRVWIRVEIGSREAVIRIEDNGHGFDLHDQNLKMGDGLANMKRRMEQIGGKVDVQSSPGDKTKVSLHLPLN